MQKKYLLIRILIFDFKIWNALASILFYTLNLVYSKPVLIICFFFIINIGVALGSVKKDSKNNVQRNKELKIEIDSFSIASRDTYPLLKNRTCNASLLINKLDQSIQNFDSIKKDSVLFTLIFKKESTKILKAIKIQLKLISDKLRENPSLKITIKGYSPVCYKRNFSFERVTNIHKYLINKLGITKDRIETRIEVTDGTVVNEIYISEQE